MAFISGGVNMWAAIACMIIIPVTVAIVTLGLLIGDDCITLDEIKEFIVWLDERADGRKKKRQERGKFYGKNSRY